MIKIQSQDFIYIDVGYALKDKEMAQYDSVQKEKKKNKTNNLYKKKLRKT